MRISRLLILLPLVAAVAACGGDDDSSATIAAPTTSTALAATTTTAAGATSTAAPTTTAPTTTTAPATTTTAAPAGPHVVQHAMGETEVPGDPQRVVVLDSSFLDASIALGVVPVGATEGTAGIGLPAYLGDSIADIELVGDTTTPNLELVAAMQPDLILAAKVRHEALYDQLSAIAPTVFSESSGTNWTDQVLLTGDALGQPTQAQALLDEFNARATAVGTAIGAPGQTATIVRFIPGQTRLYGPPTFSGSVLTAVGFDLGDKAYDPSFGMALISAEQLEMVDADVIFATTYAGEGSTRPDFEQLWLNLPAVAEGRQFDIEDSTWMTGIGVIGANKILDDLETWLG
jgi:iron complex transport system substrate-binding protein